MKMAVVNAGKQFSSRQLAHQDFMSKELKKAKYKGMTPQQKMQAASAEWRKKKGVSPSTKAKTNPKGGRATPPRDPKTGRFVKANWGTGEGARKGWDARTAGKGAGTRAKYKRGGRRQEVQVVTPTGTRAAAPRGRRTRRTRSQTNPEPAWQREGYSSAEDAIDAKVTTTYGKEHMKFMSSCLRGRGGREGMVQCAREWKAQREGAPGWGQAAAGEQFLVVPRVERYVPTKEGPQKKVYTDVVVRRKTLPRYGGRAQANPYRYNQEGMVVSSQSWLHEYLGFPSGEGQDTWFPKWSEVKEHPLASALGGLVVGPAGASTGYLVVNSIIPDKYPILKEIGGLTGALVATEVPARIVGWVLDDWLEMGSPASPTGQVTTQAVRMGGLITTGIWAIVSLYKLFSNNAFHDLADDAGEYWDKVKGWLGLDDEVTSGWSQGYEDPFIGGNQLSALQDRIGQLAGDLGITPEQMAKIEMEVDEELWGVSDAVVPAEPDDIFEGEYV